MGQLAGSGGVGGSDVQQYKDPAAMNPAALMPLPRIQFTSTGASWPGAPVSPGAASDLGINPANAKKPLTFPEASSPAYQEQRAGERQDYTKQPEPNMGTWGDYL